ncbi:MAG TPA: hypothetical protein VMA77_34875 [Solirubrobacteraceae bacterium]|nr:hypothetical protein [Solirubrobacteraceae bacterium]
MRDGIHAKRLARSRRPASVAAMLLVGALVAGCGGSSPTTAGATAGGTRSSASTAGGAYGSGPLAFSKCMRANGVPNFPDVDSNGMRIGGHGQTVSVNGVSVNAPAFTAALQKCERYRPHTYGSPAQTAQQIRQGLQFARCMRSHGVPNFPDPEVRAGIGGNQEAYLPGVNLDSPAVQSAAKACGGGPKGP